MMRALRFLVALFVSAAFGDASAQTVGLSYGSVVPATCDNTATYGVPVYTCVRNWYLSPTGSDSTGNGSAGSPWASIAKADQNTQAGDCVNLAAGTYPITNLTGMHGGGNANTSTGYVVYRGPTPGVRQAAGAGAVLQATSGGNLGNASFIMIVLGGAQGSGCNGNNSACPGMNYVIFDNIEIDGNNYTAAGGCIGTNPGGEHHLVFEHGVVHGCGTQGIGIGGGEYLWFVDNLTYNCCNANAPVEGSGISVYEPTLAAYCVTSGACTSYTPNAADNALTYKIVIANNISHDNLVGPSGCVTGQTGNGNFTVSTQSGTTVNLSTTPGSWVATTNGDLFIKDNTHSSYLTPYARITNVSGTALTINQTPSGSMNGDSVTIACGTNWGATHTDANGIILDDWQHTQNGIGSTAYTSPALIVGNTLYNNGGAGIQVYETDATSGANSVIANNSAYNNYTDVQNTSTNRGDIICTTCAYFSFINNATLPVVGGSAPTSSNCGYFQDSGGANTTFMTNIGSSKCGLVPTGTGNLYSTNPNFSAPSAGDFSLLLGSSARGLATSESWLKSTPANAGAWQFLNCTVK